MSSLPPVTNAPVSGSNVPPVSNAPVSRETLINNAHAELTHKKYDVLFKEKVSDPSGYNFITYIYRAIKFRVSDERKQAIAEDTNVTNLQKATAKLVEAMARRNLTPSECKAEDLTPITYASARTQNANIEGQKAYRNALNEFYSAFKTRVVDLKGSVDTNFANHLLAANKLISDEFSRVEKDTSILDTSRHVANVKSLNQTKFDFATKSLSVICHDDLISTFADNTDGINSESYNAKRDQIVAMFDGQTADTVDADLRKALSSRQSIRDAIAAFANQAPDAPALLAAKEKLSATDRAELTRVQERLAVLCGPNGNDGLAQRSWDELSQAKREMETIRDEYLLMRNFNFNGDRNDQAALLAALLADEPADANVIAKKAALVNAARIHDEKKAIHEAAYNEISSLAIWNGSNVVGGKEYDLKIALEDGALTRKAQVHCQKMARFLRNKTTPVQDNNANLNSRNLQAIVA